MAMLIIADKKLELTNKNIIEVKYATRVKGKKIKNLIFCFLDIFIESLVRKCMLGFYLQILALIEKPQSMLGKMEQLFCFVWRLEF